MSQVHTGCAAKHARNWFMMLTPMSWWAAEGVRLDVRDVNPGWYIEKSAINMTKAEVGAFERMISDAAKQVGMSKEKALAVIRGG